MANSLLASYSMLRVIALDKCQIMQSFDYAVAAYRDVQPYSQHTSVIIVNDPIFDVQYCMRRQGDVLTITFRGTDSPKNWVIDFAFWKQSIPYGNTASKIRVHAGFLNAYKSVHVRDQILKAITDDIHYVRINGHSMGAALSVLCAVDIEYNCPGKDIEVILFGCPRVGNKAFKRSYNKRVHKTMRVENGNDIVTKVPFAIMGFRHVGARLHIGSVRIPGLASIDDHYPHQYYSSLFKQYLPDAFADHDSPRTCT